MQEILRHVRLTQMEQSTVDMIRARFNQNPNDTRQYKTHAQWCRYLASRGSLSPLHRNCCHSGSCTHSEHRLLARKLEESYSG